MLRASLDISIVLDGQEAEDSPDEHMLQSARNLVGLSSQRLNLTTLGGQRDMSMLLAQSAVQVAGSANLPPPPPPRCYATGPLHSSPNARHSHIFSTAAMAPASSGPEEHLGRSLSISSSASAFCSKRAVCSRYKATRLSNAGCFTCLSRMAMPAVQCRLGLHFCIDVQLSICMTAVPDEPLSLCL